MARLERPGEIELHRSERGEGPLVVLAPYCWGHPGVYEALLSDLARDRRVLTWDARGTGESTRAARIVESEGGGPISEPGLAAEVIRRISAPLRLQSSR